MNLSLYLLGTSAALAIALGCLPLIIGLAKKRGLFEENNERKTHPEQVSSFGGVGIMVAFAIPMIFMVHDGASSQLIAFSLALPLFAIGLFDDVAGVKVAVRFAVQAAVGLALYRLGFKVLNLGGLWPLEAAATTLFTMLLINAYNLIDGINGLAGGLGALASTVFGVALAAKGQHEMALACFLYVGAVVGYLRFNFGKTAQIFLGDNGSTVMGFFMALMAMSVLGTEKSAGAGSSMALVLATVSVPVADLFKVAFFRALRKQSPFRPDRSHIHHLFTDKMLTHPAACAVLYGWTLALVCLAAFLPAFFPLPTVLLMTIVPYLIAKALRSNLALPVFGERRGVGTVAG
jgi:UDP-N-acetylmuramyl pentapeptide phosphotransferase/UDP-N-acetylglucosamine-1-phosphate transferase